MSVAPHRGSLGVESRGTLISPKEGSRHPHKGKPGTYDWLAPPFSPENLAGIEPIYRATHIDRLFDERYPTDAHFVAYVMQDADGHTLPAQPRVNKGGLDDLRARGFDLRIRVLCADVDNVGHARWQSHEAALETVDRVAKQVPTAAVYATAKGLRILQPVTRPLTPDEAESALGAWLADLLQCGIQADSKCVDWTRHFRAPNVRREGKPFVSPAVWRRCQEIPAPMGTALARRRRGKGGQIADVAFVRSLPTELEAAVQRLHLAIAPHASVQGSRHELALRLAGALCKRGVRPELVPTMVGRIFEGYSSDVASRVQDAEDTVRRYVGGLEVAGRLDKLFPGLDVAMHELFGGVVAPRVEGEAEPLDKLTARLEEHFRRPGDGVSLVKAGPGTGKTRTFRLVAGERAAKAGKLGTKSALSVPTTKLALQVQRDLEAAGVPCARFFGPLSVPGPFDGKACKYHRAGAALASGGLSVAKLLCRGCDIADSCPAKDGVDGPADARVAVGPHELVAELAEHAGQTGLLGIDEPPALVTIEVISLEDLKRCLLELPIWFVSRYRTCMAPIVAGTIRWLERGLDPESGPITRGLTDIPEELEMEAFELTLATDAVGWAEASMGDKPGDAPPVREDQRTRLRLNVNDARACASASHVLGLLRRAVLDHEDVSASVEDHFVGKGKEPVRRLVLVAAGKRMGAALRRVGSTVVMAADADVVRPLVARAIGYEPPMHVFRAPEVRVDRTLLRWQGANRGGWLDGGLKTGPILRAIRAAVDWYLDGPKTRPFALVTFKAIENELLEGKSDFAKDAIRELKRCPSGVALGHFGGLRGIDDWKDLDAIASLGDPYPNIGTLEREAAWIRRGRVALGAPDDWARQHAAAELEQVHGRLRTVHRTRAARQLHVGMVMPSAWGSNVRVLDAPEGRPKGVDVADMGALVDALGGRAATARALGVDVRSVFRWLSKERRPPPEVLKRLVELAAASGLDLAMTMTETSSRYVLEDLSVMGAEGSTLDDNEAAE